MKVLALLAAANLAAPSPAPDGGAAVAGQAYGYNGHARWFFNVRSLPGGKSALQLTDITEGTVRLMREDGGWHVAGPTLTAFDPPRLRVRFRADTVEMCSPGVAACATVPQIPLRQEPVRFVSGALTLHGTLWLPAKKGRYPAVLLAQGSENSDRHAIDPLPQVLASRGFAVLAYDKRGTGQSPGNWAEEGIEELSEDLTAALQSALLRHPEVRPQAVGVIGFSEGPWVALEAQRRGAGFRFLVAISGGASTKGTAFLDKEAAKLRERGLSGTEFDQAMREHRDTIAAATERARSNRRASGFDRRVAYDPTPAWRSLRVPFLWVAGEWDVLQDQVAAAEWIRNAISPTMDRDFAIVLFPRANHALFEAPSAKPSDWQRMSGIERYAPGYWPLLLQWLDDHAR